MYLTFGKHCSVAVMRNGTAPKDLFGAIISITPVFETAIRVSWSFTAENHAVSILAIGNVRSHPRKRLHGITRKLTSGWGSNRSCQVSRAGRLAFSGRRNPHPNPLPRRERELSPYSSTPEAAATVSRSLSPRPLSSSSTIWSFGRVGTHFIM